MKAHPLLLVVLGLLHNMNNTTSSLSSFTRPPYRTTELSSVKVAFHPPFLVEYLTTSAELFFLLGILLEMYALLRFTRLVHGSTVVFIPCGFDFGLGRFSGCFGGVHWSRLMGPGNVLATSANTLTCFGLDLVC